MKRPWYKEILTICLTYVKSKTNKNETSCRVEPRTTVHERNKIFHHEDTESTKRKQIADLQAFGGRLATPGMHFS